MLCSEGIDEARLRFVPQLRSVVSLHRPESPPELCGPAPAARARLLGGSSSAGSPSMLQ